MGWTAYYQILRDRPLDDGEVITLYDFARRTNRTPWEGEDFHLKVTREARPDHVLAYGFQKFPLSDESDDQERLCEVLTALSKLIDNVEVRLADDFETMGWDEDAGEAVMNGSTTELVSIRDYDSFVDPAKLVGSRPEPLPEAVDALLGGGNASRKTLEAALVEHANMPSDDPRRDALAKIILSSPPIMRVLAALDAFASLIGRDETWQLVAATALTSDEVASIGHSFLDTWKDPHGVYWYEQLLGVLGDSTLDILARVPDIEREMRDDLRAAREEGAPEMTYRRAQAAANMLGRAGSRRALFTLLEMASVLRPASDIFRPGPRPRVLPAIVEALRRFDTSEVVPTLLLDVMSGTNAPHERGPSLVALARHAPSRVKPILEHLVATGESTWTVEALQIIGDIAGLQNLCEFPDAHERERAAAALRALGVEPPAFPEMPAPEALVTHANRGVRHTALRSVEERADPATLLSFVAAAALDNELATLFDTAPSTWNMGNLISDRVRKLPLEKQVAWLRGKGGAALPEQVIWPSIARVLEVGPRAVALTYPSPWPRKQVDWEHDVAHEERRVLATLRSELGLVEAPPVSSYQDVGPLFDPAPAPVVPMPFPADPPPKHADSIYELLAVLGKEAVPSAELLARAELPPSIAQMSSWDAGRALAGHLIKYPPAQLLERLVAMLPEIHRSSAVGDICAFVFPRMIDEPGIAERLLDLWEQAIATPWDSPSRMTTYLMSVASHPTIFQRMLDEIAAPDDGPLRNRTSGAFEILSAATQHKSQAVRALVARIRRDRGRPRDLVAWRRDALRALRKLGAEDAVPTAILELAELTSMQTASELFELLARYSSGIGALQQAVDIRDCARDAVVELCRASEELRRKYSTHPFWKVRLVAADRHPDYDHGRREMAALWADIDHAGLPLAADDDRFLRPNDIKKARPDPTAPTTLPHPRDGMAASCFDYRAWSLWAVDQLADPADAAARIFADELDIAMVARGHARIAPRWSTWHAKVPDLTHDRRDRLAWARAQTYASLPPALARVRDEGAPAVAATLPAPHLVLPPELRHELEERERIVAEAGEALFAP